MEVVGNYYSCPARPLLHLLLLLTASLMMFAVSASGHRSTTRNMKKHLSELKRRRHLHMFADADDEGFEMKNYTQTVDHFNYRAESYATFNQRYAISFKHWGGAKNNSPIFYTLGAEAPIGLTPPAIVHLYAPLFRALVVIIEHRYYGESMPLGSKEETLRNTSTMGYLSTSQALADYAQFMIDLKKNLSCESCPVIAFGASYGGELAAWMRLKYPHVILGSLASSAPIRLYDVDVVPADAIFGVIANTFWQESQSCFNTIKSSWAVIDELASQPNGLHLLSKKFNTCKPLNDTEGLEAALEQHYWAAAQYNLTSALCTAIDRAPQKKDLLSRINAGLVDVWEDDCIEPQVDDQPGDFENPFNFQMCSELMAPLGTGPLDTMIGREKPWDLDSQTKRCRRLYGVTPRTHDIITQYGARNIETVLRKFASNIIFYNGDKDPFSAGGVVHNISDSIIAVTAKYGAHCTDLHVTLDSPPWLISLAKQEMEIVAGWLADYNNQLRSTT